MSLTGGYTLAGVGQGIDQGVASYLAQRNLELQRARQARLDESEIGYRAGELNSRRDSSIIQAARYGWLPDQDVPKLGTSDQVDHTTQTPRSLFDGQSLGAFVAGRSQGRESPQRPTPSGTPPTDGAEPQRSITVGGTKLTYNPEADPLNVRHWNRLGEINAQGANRLEQIGLQGQNSLERVRAAGEARTATGLALAHFKASHPTAMQNPATVERFLQAVAGTYVNAAGGDPQAAVQMLQQDPHSKEYLQMGLSDRHILGAAGKIQQGQQTDDFRQTMGVVSRSFGTIGAGQAASDVHSARAVTKRPPPKATSIQADPTASMSDADAWDYYVSHGDKPDQATAKVHARHGQ